MAEMDNWPKITLFGDSITRLSMDPENGNWASYLAHELGDYYQIDIKGFSGFTTKFAVKVAKELFTEKYLQNVDLFFMFFGHNDAWESPLFPGITAEDYQKNMKNLIDHLVSNGLPKESIIIITPGWYDQITFSRHREDEKKADLTKTLEHSIKYAEIAAKVAKDLEITFIDWWLATLEHKPFEELFNDGLHLSQRGAKLLYELIWPTVKEKIELKHRKPIKELAMVQTPEELSEARRKSFLNN